MRVRNTGADQRAYQMTMRKGDPSYATTARRSLFAERGTELKINPLLDGIRTLSGEKIQWYLASELRDRIRHAGVRVTVVDKLARKQDLRTLPGLEHEPWTSGCLQGLIDAPFLNLTPGTRSGIIQDDRYAALLEALAPLEAALHELIAEQRRICRLPSWHFGFIAGYPSCVGGGAQADAQLARAKAV